MTDQQPHVESTSKKKKETAEAKCAARLSGDDSFCPDTIPLEALPCAAICFAAESGKIVAANFAALLLFGASDIQELEKIVTTQLMTRFPRNARGLPLVWTDWPFVSACEDGGVYGATVSWRLGEKRLHVRVEASGYKDAEHELVITVFCPIPESGVLSKPKPL